MQLLTSFTKGALSIDIETNHVLKLQPLQSQSRVFFLWSSMNEPIRIFRADSTRCLDLSASIEVVCRRKLQNRLNQARFLLFLLVETGYWMELLDGNDW